MHVCSLPRIRPTPRFGIRLESLTRTYVTLPVEISGIHHNESVRATRFHCQNSQKDRKVIGIIYFTYESVHREHIHIIVVEQRQPKLTDDEIIGCELKYRAQL